MAVFNVGGSIVYIHDRFEMSFCFSLFDDYVIKIIRNVVRFCALFTLHVVFTSLKYNHQLDVLRHQPVVRLLLVF